MCVKTLIFPYEVRTSYVMLWVSCSFSYFIIKSGLGVEIYHHGIFIFVCWHEWLADVTQILIKSEKFRWL